MGIFRFKQFCVDDSGSAMKIGTDGVLLGAWARADGAGMIVDAGCGTGLIALMMAQRYPLARITGVEIDEAAAGDARANAAASPWADRVATVCADVLSWPPAAGRPTDGSLCIVSNPPFYTESLRSPESSRALARHGEGFGVDSLIEWASGLMTGAGDSLSFIAPAGRDDEIQYRLSLHRLTPSRITDVVSTEGRAPVRRLYEAVRDDAAAGPCVCDSVVIRDRSGAYTQPYVDLTGAFYINL